jgi:hypothetical protein
MGWCGLDRSGSGQGQVESSCECGSETSSFNGFTTGGLSSSAQFY